MKYCWLTSDSNGEIAQALRTKFNRDKNGAVALVLKSEDGVGPTPQAAQGGTHVARQTANRRIISSRRRELFVA